MKLGLWLVQTKDIDRQIAEYVEHKSKRSTYVAKNQNEWLHLFKKTSGVESVFEINQQIMIEFEDYMLANYPADYFVRQALNALRSFKRYYRVRG